MATKLGKSDKKTEAARFMLASSKEAVVRTDPEKTVATKKVEEVLEEGE